MAFDIKNLADTVERLSMDIETSHCDKIRWKRIVIRPLTSLEAIQASQEPAELDLGAE